MTKVYRTIYDPVSDSFKRQYRKFSTKEKAEDFVNKNQIDSNTIYVVN